MKKSNKDRESEVLKVYNLYWDRYLKGDLEAFASTMDEAFEMIGTSEFEVCHNKAEGIEFYKAQIQEVVGKTEMRNRIISHKPLGDMFLVNEACDVYILGTPEWTFYSKLRLSTILHETKSGWKIIQQHGSLPDMRVEKGETMAFEKITKENLELRDAVKRRTAELERKSRELAIEAALEKVRAVAMGMKKPEDMLEVCESISDRLKDFGVSGIRNIQTAIIDENNGIYLCYQYFTQYETAAIERTEYLKSPVEEDMVKQMLASKNGHFTGKLTGNELIEFREHRKAEKHFPDPLMDETDEISHCFLSIGQGGLGLTLYQAMDASTLDLFNRFHQVFSLAYQRFHDIQKAEARAREVEIDLALERVRAQTMAMHSSEDVGNCILKMFAELTALGVDEGTRFGIGILNYENENNELWTARMEGKEVKMHIGNIDMKAHPLLKSARKAWLEKVIFHKYILEGKDLLDYYQMLNKAPDYKIQIPLEKLPQREVQHCFIFEHGFFYAFCPQEFQPELIQTIQRFSTQFAQTYRRYLDLVMAEAQAREARIEAALEKVRSRSLAMHRSDELKGVIQEVYDQLLQLKIHVDHAGFIIDYKEREDMHIWLADHQQGVPTEITIPYFDTPHWNSYREAKARQESFFANLLPFEVKNKFYQDLFKWIPDLTGEAQQAIFTKPALAISTVLLDNVGLYIEHYSETPYTAEENKILMRIGKVFQQTYTRFLDLQKAEAQAREAQIEAAVERVRAQSMAMHRTDDLHKVTEELLYQLNNLSVDGLTRTTIYLVDENDIVTAWDLSSPGNIGTPGNFTFSYDAKKYPVIGGWVETWRTSNQNYFSLEFPKEALLNAVQEWKKIHPEIAIIFENAVVSGKLTHQWSPAGRLSKGILAVDLTKPPTNDTKNIVTKMAGAFNLAFQRFEDLQNAEAQAREAEIELALERVRARTMAMQHSYELTEASEVLDLQVRTLGIETWGCAFHIYADDPEGDYEWFSSREGTLPFYKTPRENFFLKFYEKGKAGETFHVEEFLGEDCKAHYDYLMTIPVMGDALREIVSSGSSLPESQYDHIAFFKHGFLLFITYESVPESHAIFQRFAKVFEQTYTRFLDLQKAEEQAREAQINLAVERIRAMALAMHQTSELKEVIKVVDDQIKALNVDNSGGAFIVINEDLQNGFSCWGAGGVGNYIRKVDIPFLDRPIYKELKKGIESRTPFFTENYGFDEKWEFFKHLFKHAPFDETPPERQKALLSNSLGYARSCVVSNNTSIFIINHNGKAFKEEENKILREIGRVFEQAYTRFLDLQKAETQAREAKIETALEKVRSRTMGMQNSEELPEVANLLFTEVRALGIHAWSCGYNILAEDKKSATCCMSSEGTLQSPFQLRLWGEASFDEMGQFLLSDQKMLVQELGGKALEEHYAYMKSFPDLKPTFDEIDRLGLSLPTFQINHLCKFNQGFILFITYEKVPGAHDIFKRFTKVFDQTYTRFLDLQKAEAQAREARIEAALERVRSRTMGMQKAEELGEVATILFAEMNTLVENLWTCGFVLCEKNRKEDEWWLSLTNGLIEPFSLPNIGDYAHEMLYKGWEKGKAYRKVTLENKLLQEHYNWLMRIPIARKIFEDMEGSGIPRPNWQCLHAAYFKTGYLVIITEVPCEEEEVFKRFAQVFDLTYTRFLDLQKAEKQARESQIQAALEKVRSRSLAMQSPAELIEVAQLLREEMGALDVEDLETSSIYIQDESSGLTECWFTIKNTKDPGKAVADQMTIKLEETWVGRQMRDFFQSSAEKTSILMQGKNRIEWIRYCEGKSKLFGTSNFYGETIPERTYHLYKFSNGYIGAAAPGEISSESWDLLKRATAVFSFAFTRFQDLQRAEASARASMRQASLDRLRADISSMRSASDLDRITPLIFKELTVLGVPFIRCGVFIIQEKQKIVEAYLSSPEGNSLGVLRLPYQASELTYQTVEAWRKGVVYHQHWNKEDFIRWINQLMEQDQIQDSSTYQGAAAPPESLDLHFVPFKQGMLYVGNVSPLGEDEIELVQSLAKAFSIAYARFEDFVKLEQAKVEVESAMSELKATQSQLVQQEKLASLGQLTAGIAHEIKNPLNFVNNFSEVSIELVDEAIEERAKSQEARDETLVDEILEDIKSNLKKVHEHGSRANGIVTSMLQHSRGGSGKKEPTDLNALTKEYVNLSFHGMRAGKNPINVDIILNLDPEIKEVSLIKEDFTRVIINLCNNAFDAMRGKKYEDGEPLGGSYSPKLRASTILKNGQIKISFEDNGPGIPDEIKDKILQPFFTTKKGTEGTGLGLSITHDIVKAHGGELRVESEIGKGTTFTVILNHHPSPINI